MTKRYEDLIQELKEVIRKIENGETSLEESIALYERGTLLITECETLLNEAELRITRLTPDSHP
jgi:exodeoxyribonuclease VII small subunit